MNARVREILRRMEDHCAFQAKGDPIRTTPGVLDDKDSFDDGKLSLMEVLNLKRVLTRLSEPVNYEHYGTTYRAHNEYAVGGGYLIKDWERQLLEAELNKPRNLPKPELPEREITLKEKARVLHIVENALKEFGMVSDPSTQCVYVKMPKGNGMDFTEERVPDSSIGRRLVELHKELTSLRIAVTPLIAKDKTPFAGRTYWNTGNQWKKEHIRECHYCGSVCDVNTYNWESISEKA